MLYDPIPTPADHTYSGNHKLFTADPFNTALHYPLPAHLQYVQQLSELLPDQCHVLAPAPLKAKLIQTTAHIVPRRLQGSYNAAVLAASPMQQRVSMAGVLFTEVQHLVKPTSVCSRQLPAGLVLDDKHSLCIKVRC